MSPDSEFEWWRIIATLFYSERNGMTFDFFKGKKKQQKPKDF